MKLHLVISLALWQTSNGKYVNEEYEPAEIQDQVFEASGDYTSNYGVASDDEDLYNEDGSGDGLYVSREEEDLLEDLEKLEEDALIEIEDEYEDVEFDDEDDLDDYEDNYEEITQLDNEDEEASPEDISETLKDYEETVVNLNKKVDATMKKLEEDERKVEEAIEEFVEEETKLLELEHEEVAAMEDLEDRIEAEIEDNSEDEYEIEYVGPEESEEEIIIIDSEDSPSIVETVIEDVEKIAEEVADEISEDISEVTEEILDDTSSISQADYNEYDDSISDKSENYNPEPRIVGLDTDQGSATIQNAVIAGVIAAMLICIVGILFVVHRIKKKDEGSYKISASPSQKQSLLNEEAYA